MCTSFPETQKLSCGYVSGFLDAFFIKFEEIKMKGTSLLTSLWKVNLTRDITTRYSVSFSVTLCLHLQNLLVKLTVRRHYKTPRLKSVKSTLWKLSQSSFSTLNLSMNSVNSMNSF